MNAHALARLLLVGPDLPVGYRDHDGDYVNVEAVEPHDDRGVESLELRDETAEEMRARYAAARQARLGYLQRLAAVPTDF